MKSCARTICCSIAMLAAGMLFSAFAGGPYYVTGPGAAVPGEAYRWSGSLLRYKTDLGNLGRLTNAEADAMVSAAFQVWEDVDTASIGFQHDGKLSGDVTADNILGFQNALGMCSDPSQPSGSIVYDLDGSIIEALGMDKNSVLGFTGVVCTDDRLGTYTRGWAVMNGRSSTARPTRPGTGRLRSTSFTAPSSTNSGTCSASGIPRSTSSAPRNAPPRTFRGCPRCFRSWSVPGRRP